MTTTIPNYAELLDKSSQPEPMTRELLYAGWKKIHATDFWCAPNGMKFPTTAYAFQALKENLGVEKRGGVADRRRQAAPPLEPNYDLATLAAREAEKQSTRP